MAPTVEILKNFALDLRFTEFPSGEEGVKQYGSRKEFESALRAAIDQSDSTLFGSTNGTTGGIGYLRWGKQTYANVRPARWRPGFRSPLKNPEAIDFVVVRENLEDLYMGVEGDLNTPCAARLDERDYASTARYYSAGPVCHQSDYRARLPPHRPLRLRTGAQAQGPGWQGASSPVPASIICCGKVTGYSVKVVEATAKEYPDLGYEQYIVDDFARRLVASPSQFDVVVMPKLVR